MPELWKIAETFAYCGMLKPGASSEVAGCTFAAERKVERAKKDLTEYWEEISKRDSIQQETRVSSRIGQDKLRKYLLAQGKGQCIITEVDIPCLLVASHIKPWRDCSCNKEECLDPENILLLAKNYDALFDAGLISFSPEDGLLIRSAAVSEEVCRKMGIDLNARISDLSVKRKEYLRYHVENVLKR